MASYAALVSLESTLEKFIRQDQLQILDDEDTRRPFNLLKQNVALLLDFLDNSPASARQLEKKIGDSAYEAECIIENHVWEARFNGKVSVHVSNKLFLDIKNIATEIESIVRKAEQIKSNAVGEDDSRSKDEPLSIPESGVHKNKDKVVGFDDELGRVKDRIFSNDSEMVTIPIVGMGGIGKTTLARAAFDDPAVIDHFDVRRWVTVSQIYDSRAILLAILDEKSSNETESLKDLSLKVHHLLYRRRYIIVVDDIWSLDAWDGVKRFIPDDNNCSRVLLTTRDQNVASYASASSTSIHHLGLMDRERSLRLLEQRVFGEEACCPPELVKIGETISEGCKGLPLAIVVIAGILSNTKPTPNSWEKIANDVNMALSKGGEQFSEILSLSYHHLPHFLKPCFLYFGAFLDDRDIHVSNLIRLWVSEGFLKAKPPELEEEIAYGCLEDLTKRNLIMITKKRYNGKIKVCRIHDLLRQLCIRRAEEEKFIYHAKDMMELGIVWEGISSARRICFDSRVSTQLVKRGECSVHSALCFQDDNHLISMLLPCRLLRVLDITAVISEKFPSEIFQLYYLKFLAFTYKSMRDFKLPEDICNLENLETLIGHPGRDFGDTTMVILPPEFWTLKNLRHAIFYDKVVLPGPLSQMFPLKNLLTLSRLRNFRCTDDVVELIHNVRKIVVDYDIDFRDVSWHDYHLNNFGTFSKLESLTVMLQVNGYEMGSLPRYPFLECLVLPLSLRRLSIQGGEKCISWEELTVALGPLPNLETLKLKHFVCSGDVWETREGDFQNLRVLEIFLSDFKCWITESPSHFPNLERLVLNDCSKLTELPYCIGDIPTLQVIKVDDYQQAIVHWARRIEEEQRDIENEFLKIEVEEMAQLRDKDKEDLFGEVISSVFDRIAELEYCHIKDLKKAVNLVEQLGAVLQRLFVCADKENKLPADEDVDQFRDLKREEKFGEKLYVVFKMLKFLERGVERDNFDQLRDLFGGADEEVDKLTEKDYSGLLKSVEKISENLDDVFQNLLAGGDDEIGKLLPDEEVDEHAGLLKSVEKIGENFYDVFQNLLGGGDDETGRLLHDEEVDKPTDLNWEEKFGEKLYDVLQLLNVLGGGDEKNKLPAIEEFQQRIDVMKAVNLAEQLGAVLQQLNLVGLDDEENELPTDEEVDQLRNLKKAVNLVEQHSAIFKVLKLLNELDRSSTFQDKLRRNFLKALQNWNCDDGISLSSFAAVCEEIVILHEGNVKKTEERGAKEYMGS